MNNFTAWLLHGLSFVGLLYLINQLFILALSFYPAG